MHQPSKLSRRVRFSLPAPIEYKKARTLIVAGFFVPKMVLITFLGIKNGLDSSYLCNYSCYHLITNHNNYMKLLNTLTALSILGLTSFSNAAETCRKTCDKGAKKVSACAGKCSSETCDLEAADMTTFIVTGMTCSDCSGKLKTSLGAIEGVTVKKVCHKSGHVMVKYDEAKTDKSKVITAIAATGFKVAGEKLNIPVSGMTCGDCSDKVAKALTSLEGCSGIGVCHKSGHASVVIDTAKTSEAKVMEVINATGFKVTKEAKVAPATETTKVKS